MLGGIMPDRPERYQKNQSGNAGDNHQPDVDCAMKYLAAMTVGALGQMLFVVAPHFRRKAGNVITPSSEYVPDYFIAANTTHRTPGFGSPCYSELSIRYVLTQA